MTLKHRVSEHPVDKSPNYGIKSLKCKAALTLHCNIQQKRLRQRHCYTVSEHPVDKHPNYYS